MKYTFSKIAFSLIVFTYVFSSVGISLVAHYCEGSLEKVALFSKPTSCCEGEDTESDDCCSNESKYVSFQKDFTFSTTVSDCKISVQQLFIVDYNKLYQFQNNNINRLFLSLYKKNHPPNLVQEDIIINSVLRI